MMHTKAAAIPYFVGIGAQKAGTTWLARYLKEHPQIGFSPIKELHFFDAKYCPEICNKFNDRMVERLCKVAAEVARAPSLELTNLLMYLTLRVEMSTNTRRYVDYFQLLYDPSIHRAVGEFTPAYSMLDRTGFGAILSLFPCAKFVFVMRDPVDRFWSQMRYQNRSNSCQTDKTKLDPRICLNNPHYVRRTDYAATLRELYACVRRERVCVLFYEQLTATHTAEETMRKLTNFLEVAYRPPDVTTRINSSVAMDLEMADRRIIAQRFHHVYNFVKMHWELPAKWRESYALSCQ